MWAPGPKHARLNGPEMVNRNVRMAKKELLYLVGLECPTMKVGQQNFKNW